MMQSTQPELYMNMQQFSDLKLEARQDSAAAGVKAAQQFEGLFIQSMLKSMRSAAIIDESQHSSYMDFYTDMYDKQLSVMMSQQGGIGIADMMQQQLNQYLPEGQVTAAKDGKELPAYRLDGTQGSKSPAYSLDGSQRAELSGYPLDKQQGFELSVYQLPSSTSGRQLPVPVMDYVAVNPAVKAHELRSTAAALAASVDSSEAAPALQTETIDPFYGWQEATSFVQDLWPHAEKAAEKLGVSADVLVAQSVLETGWGKHSMVKPDGSVAFNLFGIKAGGGWAGQSVTHNTLEFRNGSMQREAANFRAYDSVSEAVEDYVSFVTTRSRYADALAHGGSDSEYVTGLQQAGYATDPDYARKINNIMNGQTFKQALASLPADQLSTRNSALS